MLSKKVTYKRIYFSKFIFHWKNSCACEEWYMRQLHMNTPSFWVIRFNSTEKNLKGIPYGIFLVYFPRIVWRNSWRDSFIRYFLGWHTIFCSDFTLVNKELKVLRVQIRFEGLTKDYVYKLVYVISLKCKQHAFFVL